MTWLKQWFAQYGGFTHALAGATATVVLLYASVPAFQSLVNSAYSHTPSWFHDVAVAGIGIYAFYHGAQK